MYRESIPCWSWLSARSRNRLLESGIISTNDRSDGSQRSLTWPQDASNFAALHIWRHMSPFEIVQAAILSQVHSRADTYHARQEPEDPSFMTVC